MPEKIVHLFDKPEDYAKFWLRQNVDQLKRAMDSLIRKSDRECARRDCDELLDEAHMAAVGKLASAVSAITGDHVEDILDAAFEAASVRWKDRART